MKNDAVLVLSEAFYSLQGEGRTMGIPAIFLRLTGCNLMCGGWGVERDGVLRDGATWVCDTIAVWLRGRRLSFELLLNELNERLDFVQRLRQGVHLVITGGEPLLQQERILHFLRYLETQHQCQPTVEIETNATVLPLPELDERVHYWNTSPKLQNSGMNRDKRYYPEILAWFGQNPKTMAKFVIRESADFEEIKRDFLDTDLLPRPQLVLMPGADNRAELGRINQTVADICIREQIRMSSRLHIEIWDQKTGV